jgi:hypothetical protein
MSDDQSYYESFLLPHFINGEIKGLFGTIQFFLKKLVYKN